MTATAPSGIELSFIVPPALTTESLAALASWAAGAGFAAVDAEASWDDGGIAAIRRAGLALGPMRLRASLADSDPATRAAAVDAACRAIDHAAGLGLTTVWTLPRNFRNDRSPRDNFAAALETLPVVAAHAERAGIRVAIENCPFDGQNPVCTPEAWDALFAAVPSPALGICFDPSHCVWQGIDVRRTIRGYAARIYHAHAKDTELLPEGRDRFGVAGPQLADLGAEGSWPRHGWWRHRLPGLGEVDWNGFVTALADAGYAGYLTVEHEDPLWEGGADRVKRGLARSRDYLATLVP